jgi:hypothetical protein
MTYKSVGERKQWERTKHMTPADGSEIAALRRLIKLAHGQSGQCKRVADFLLAWWNAGSCGGFDLTDLWAVDDQIADDMITVMKLIAKMREYPDALGFRAEFERMVEEWRPALLGVSTT